jgi:hypothetical protein
MRPEDNPGLEELRFPDFVHDETLSEIKSTRVGLGARDLVQIGEMLQVSATKGTVRVDGTPRIVKAMRLVFTDSRGAHGSVDALDNWLTRYPKLTVEVFGKQGARIEITKATLTALKKQYNGVDPLRWTG